MIKKGDYNKVIKFYDDDALEYYPEVEDDEELLDMFGGSNSSYICIRGETVPIELDIEKKLLIVFDQYDSKADPDEAVEILKNCNWEDTPLKDKDNYIAIMNGMHYYYDFYNF